MADTDIRFSLNTTNKTTLEQTAITNGSVYFVNDTKELFFDFNSTRTEIKDILILENDIDRTSILFTPLNKFYFVLETTILWLYKDGNWYQVSEDMSLYYSKSEIDELLAGKVDNADVSAKLSDLENDIGAITSILDTVQLKSDETLNTEDKTVVGAINEIKQTFDDAVVTPQATYSNPAVYLGKDFTTTDNAIESISLNGGVNTMLASELEIIEDGYYVVSADLIFKDSSQTAGKRILCNILLNGITFAQNTVTTQSSNANNILTITGVANCSKGNKFTLQVVNGLTGALNVTLYKFSAVRVYSPFDLDKVNSDLSNLQATSKDVESLKSQVGDITAILDNINGEVV